MTVARPDIPFGWVGTCVELETLSLGQIHVSSAVEKLPDSRPRAAEAGHGKRSALHLSMSRVWIGSPIQQKAYDVQGPAVQSSALAVRAANGSHMDEAQYCDISLFGALRPSGRQ